MVIKAWSGYTLNKISSPWPNFYQKALQKLIKVLESKIQVNHSEPPPSSTFSSGSN